MAKPPHVGLEIWRNLYDAALSYAQRRPWEILSDLDLFALRSSLINETLYACAIGQEGISYGLLLYRGEKGLASYRWLAEKGSRADVDGYISRQNQITLEFVPRKELDKFDRVVIRNLGWAKLKSPMWPQFRTMRPYEPPWHLDEKEAMILTLALVCGNDFVDRLRDRRLFLPLPANQIPAYEIFESAEGKLPKALPPPIGIAPPIYRPLPAKPLSVDPERIMRILDVAKPYKGSWEADISTLKMVIGGEDRPFIPLLLLITDQQSGFILDSYLSKEVGEPHQILADGI